MEDAAELLEDGEGLFFSFLFFEYCNVKLSIAMLLFEPPFFPLVLEKKIHDSEYQIHRLYFCSKPNSRWYYCTNHKEDPICLPVAMPMKSELVTSEHALWL